MLISTSFQNQLVVAGEGGIISIALSFFLMLIVLSKRPLSVYYLTSPLHSRHKEIATDLPNRKQFINIESCKEWKRIKMISIE